MHRNLLILLPHLLQGSLESGGQDAIVAVDGRPAAACSDGAEYWKVVARVVTTRLEVDGLHFFQSSVPRINSTT